MPTQGALLRLEPRYLVHHDTLLHIFLLQSVRELSHVINQVLVASTVLPELLQHVVGGDRVLDKLTVDVGDED